MSCLCKCGCVAIKFVVLVKGKESASILLTLTLLLDMRWRVDMQIYVCRLLCVHLRVCVCVCVCVYVCEQALVTRPLVLAESRCTGVSESFLFMRSVLLEVGHFPKVLALFPPLSPPFSSSLSLSDSFVLNSGNQYPSLFPLLLFSLGQHSLHISMTYEHHKSQPKLASLHFVSPFSQKWGSMREDRGPSLTFRSLLSRK